MILTIALMLVAQADAADWVEFSRDRQQTHYIDVHSIAATADRIFMRHRVDLAEALPNSAVSAEFEVEIRCEERTIALLRGVERNRSGAVIESHGYSPPRYRPIDHHTLGEWLFNFVCDR